MRLHLAGDARQAQVAIVPLRCDVVVEGQVVGPLDLGEILMGLHVVPEALFQAVDLLPEPCDTLAGRLVALVADVVANAAARHVVLKLAREVGLGAGVALNHPGTVLVVGVGAIHVADKRLPGVGFLLTLHHVAQRVAFLLQEVQLVAGLDPAVTQAEGNVLDAGALHLGHHQVDHGLILGLDAAVRLGLHGGHQCAGLHIHFAAAIRGHGGDHAVGRDGQPVEVGHVGQRIDAGPFVGFLEALEGQKAVILRPHEVFSHGTGVLRVVAQRAGHAVGQGIGDAAVFIHGIQVGTEVPGGLALEVEALGAARVSELGELPLHNVAQVRAVTLVVVAGIGAGNVARHRRTDQAPAVGLLPEGVERLALRKLHSHLELCAQQVREVLVDPECLVAGKGKHGLRVRCHGLQRLHVVRAVLGCVQRASGGHILHLGPVLAVELHFPSIHDAAVASCVIDDHRLCAFEGSPVDARLKLHGQLPLEAFGRRALLGDDLLHGADLGFVGRDVLAVDEAHALALPVLARDELTPQHVRGFEQVRRQASHLVQEVGRVLAQDDDVRHHVGALRCEGLRRQLVGAQELGLAADLRPEAFPRPGSVRHHAGRHHQRDKAARTGLVDHASDEVAFDLLFMLVGRIVAGRGAAGIAKGNVAHHGIKEVVRGRHGQLLEALIEDRVFRVQHGIHRGGYRVNLGTGDDGTGRLRRAEYTGAGGRFENVAILEAVCLENVPRALGKRGRGVILVLAVVGKAALAAVLLEQGNVVGRQGFRIAAGENLVGDAHHLRIDALAGLLAAGLEAEGGVVGGFRVGGYGGFSYQRLRRYGSRHDFGSNVGRSRSADYGAKLRTHLVGRGHQSKALEGRHGAATGSGNIRLHAGQRAHQLQPGHCTQRRRYDSTSIVQGCGFLLGAMLAAILAEVLAFLLVGFVELAGHCHRRAGLGVPSFCTCGHEFCLLGRRRGHFRRSGSEVGSSGHHGCLVSINSALEEGHQFGVCFVAHVGGLKLVGQFGGQHVGGGSVDYGLKQGAVGDLLGGLGCCKRGCGGFGGRRWLDRGGLFGLGNSRRLFVLDGA